MTRYTTELRRELLALLQLDRGHAGDSGALSPQTFYPIEAHLEALDPAVVFVVGPRGSGKSKLVEAITSDGVRPALARRARGTLPRDGGQWHIGHPYGSSGPSNRAWQTFAASSGHDTSRLQTLWLGLLVRTVAHRMTDEDRAALAPILQAPGSDGDALHDATASLNAQVEGRLDGLDLALQKSERFVFIVYDELDTQYYTDWSRMLQVLRGLTAMWAGYYRRWKRLRPKLFVRTDLFDEQYGLMTSDAAKMAARRVELHWSDRDLYGALFKQIIHRDKKLMEYFRPKLSLHDDNAFGQTPAFESAKSIDPAVARLCGEFMGANANKGHTRTWLLNAIRDGAGRASPRNLIQLIEKAGSIEHRQMRPVHRAAQLLHHVSLRNALTEVSRDHVRDATQSEHPWLDGFQRRLHSPQSAREVPWQRRDLEKYLASRWDEPWSNQLDRPRPPAQTPGELVDRLLRLGVLRARKDGTLDTPDLYLEGLDLFRRGGVARQ